MNNNSDNSYEDYDFRAFNNLDDIEEFSFYEDKFSFEDETIFPLLGILMILWGICFVFWHPFSISLFKYIILILSLLFFGFLTIRYLNSYIVLNTTNNTLYREYRLGIFIFFRWKIVKLSDIIRLGITHKLGNPINYGSSLNSLVFKLFYLVFKRANYLDVKPISPEYGGLEKTALIYLTKKGKIRYLTNYTYYEAYDTLYSILGNTLSSYAKIPFIKANSFNALTVEKMANRYFFGSKRLRLPIIHFSEDFLRFIIPLAIMLLTIGIIAILLNFDLI